jgi:NAD(P)-dependent dehydrogenase (short-subunit alcohol dehydrogenase family)
MYRRSLLMATLSSISREANIAVFGAGGAIGGAFVRHLAADPQVSTVYALSRQHVEPHSANVAPCIVDINDEASIADAVGNITAEGPLDIVLVATGILHEGDELRPEKTIRDLSAHTMARVFAINTIAPAMIARHCLPQLRRGNKSVFAALSARVGSIADNRLGGWVSYRASKAALNMTLKTLAIEHARRFPDSVVAALHPGTVDSALSAPFQRNVPGDQLFTPDRAAKQLLAVIDDLSASDSGGFFAWDGQPIEY